MLKYEHHQIVFIYNTQVKIYITKITWGRWILQILCCCSCNHVVPPKRAETNLEEVATDDLETADTTHDKYTAGMVSYRMREAINIFLWLQPLQRTCHWCWWLQGTCGLWRQKKLCAHIWGTGYHYFLTEYRIVYGTRVLYG